MYQWDVGHVGLPLSLPTPLGDGLNPSRRRLSQGVDIPAIPPSRAGYAWRFPLPEFLRVSEKQVRSNTPLSLSLLRPTILLSILDLVYVDALFPCCCWCCPPCMTFLIDDRTSIVDAGANANLVLIFRPAKITRDAELSGFANFLAGGFGGMNTATPGFL